LILYVDTSSLIKLYVQEDGSEEVRQTVHSSRVVSTCVIAYAEARAALARQRREGGLTPSGHDRAKAALEHDWPRFLTIGVTESVYRKAGDLAETHRLRGFDSLHLASFLWLYLQSVPQPVTFSSFDKRLNRAAREVRGAKRS